MKLLSIKINLRYWCLGKDRGSLEGMKFEQVCSYKYLGIHSDALITWKINLKYISSFQLLSTPLKNFLFMKGEQFFSVLSSTVL